MSFANSMALTLSNLAAQDASESSEVFRPIRTGNFQAAQ